MDVARIYEAIKEAKKPVSWRRSVSFVWKSKETFSPRARASLVRQEPPPPNLDTLDFL